MNRFPEEYRIHVGAAEETPFLKRSGIRQDGTTPMYRDVDGKLWAITGHSHLGHIGMFCGTTLGDMVEKYPISTNFCVGHADYAFSGVRYPEGIKPRGSIWPFGLYICPNTHRFFCFFHNESGWNGKGTAYDAFGLCEKPRVDSDFRHVGLMHSDDEGKNWTFDRWVLTAHTPSFTESYNPMEDCAIGQMMGRICLGSGDFSIFVEPEGEYIYLFYSMIYVDTEKGVWDACDCYAARTRKRTDGLMGDFVKFYNGEFCEAGNLGRETVVAPNAWHPRVVYSEKYGKYILCASPIHKGRSSKIVANLMQWRVSDDLIHWSEPVWVERDGQPFGDHYIAMASDEADLQPHIIRDDTFVILTNHNGTDVTRYEACFEKME